MSFFTSDFLENHVFDPRINRIIVISSFCLDAIKIVITIATHLSYLLQHVQIVQRSAFATLL